MYKDDFPMIHLCDTDGPLPGSATTKNNLRYGMFRWIATGGTCVIHACKDFYLNRIVCHKKLRPELAKDEVQQKRFLREARVTALIQHPNTIPVYDIGRDREENLYFTMKLVRGLSLQEILDEKRESPSSSEHSTVKLVNVLIQAAHALSYAHSHGVIHRDIKPSNILVGPFGEVLLIDWGLAKVWDDEEDELKSESSRAITDYSLTSADKIVATPLYMSPEQADSSSDVDHRTDIYSLGVVLYELLTLKMPHEGSSLYELTQAISTELPPAPSLVASEQNVPTELDSICMGCLQTDPADRIQRIDTVVAQLQGWLHA